MMRMLAVSVLMALSLACDGTGEKNSKEPSLSVRTNPVPADGGSQFMTVTADGDWTLSVAYGEGAEGWISINSMSGSGTLDVILSVARNTAEESRTVTISVLSGQWKKDLALTQNGTSGGGGDNPGGGGDNPGGTVKAGWLELPAMPENSEYGFFSHNMTLNGRTIRNFSFSWDYDNLVAPWVAYPLNRGLISSGSRTDEWGADPSLPTDKQPILYRGYSSTGGTRYDRGHQLPSADRYERNANVQTFYFTNMTPQINAFNGQIWGNLEGTVRSWANQSDTLYVVTGCITEGSTAYALDNNGKHVTVPTKYYKVVLRYSSSSSSGINGYMACAILLDHRQYSSQAINSSYSMSVDELEEITGWDFFPNLITKIGAENAAKVEAEDPADNQWWWAH